MTIRHRPFFAYFIISIQVFVYDKARTAVLFFLFLGGRRCFFAWGDFGNRRSNSEDFLLALQEDVDRGKLVYLYCTSVNRNAHLFSYLLGPV
jgi:hypothetical protein